MEIIEKYFPELTETQREQFDQLKELYIEWNNKINVISRKDLENFYERHVLHSLGIAKTITFQPGSEILDIGTGGGFPGIPLAILFPECNFHLVDSIGKKILVVSEVAKAIGLTNVKAEHQRGEKIKGQYDFIVSRAVTRLNRFLPWTRGKIKKTSINEKANGLLYLKGGDLHEELNEAKTKHKPQLFDLTKFYEEDFFETKKVVYLPL